MAAKKDKEKKVKANPILDDEDENETGDEESTETVTKSKVQAKAETDDEDGQDLITGEKPVVKAQSNVQRELSKGASETKLALDKQEKVRVFIPLGIGEKQGVNAVETVTINGLRMVLPKGVYSTVPKAVAEIIERHYNMTSENTETGAAFNLANNRTRDGMSTNDALN